MRFEVVLEIDIWQFFVKHGFSTMSQKLEIRGLPVAISGHDGYYDYRFLQKVFMFVYVVGAWHPTLSSYDSRSVWKSKLVCCRKQYFLVRPRDLKLAGSLLRFEITLDIAIRIFPPQKNVFFGMPQGPETRPQLDTSRGRSGNWKFAFFWKYMSGNVLETWKSTVAHCDFRSSCKS